MKKIIVVLLILACVVSGLSAALAQPTEATQLIITADVGAGNIIKVTDQPYVFTTYEALAALDDTVTSSTVINSSNYRAKSVSVGHLNYFTNQTAGLSTTVVATSLTNGFAGKESEITYVVRLDAVEVARSLTEEMGDEYTPTNVMLVPANSDVYRQGSKAITISIDPDSFDKAVRGSGYSGTITFSYVVD